MSYCLKYISDTSLKHNLSFFDTNMRINIYDLNVYRLCQIKLKCYEGEFNSQCR